MEEETETNLETEVADETASTEAELQEQVTGEDQEDELGEEGQIDTEEVEIDGKKYSVPKELAPKIMMQADYTRKTQEVAEIRKETEAERASWHEQAKIRDALFTEKAELHQMDKRLSAYRNTNWQLWHSQDPNGAQAAQMEYVQLRDHRENLSGHIQGREAELNSKYEQETALSWNKSVEALNKPDPRMGWDGKFDTVKNEQLSNFGKEVGFTDEELRGTSHPLMIKTLQLAKIGYDFLNAKKTATARTPAEPAARVPTSRATSPINAKTASMEAYASARKAGRIK